MRLTRAGILIHVDQALPHYLGGLVRALLDEYPDIEVLTDVRAAADAPVGSVLVLVPKAEDADWLNLQRPIFSQRQLKAILFCDRATTLALAERAVDFFDWVSQHHDCPQGPSPYAMFGLRRAFAAKAPGMMWIGADADVEGMWRVLSATFPGETLQWVLPQRDYEEIVETIRRAGDGWVACRIRAESHVTRFRWALAEAGKRTRAIAVMERPECPGWWLVHDRQSSLVEAQERLKALGIHRPGRLAALTGLEPEAVDLAQQLLEEGFTEADLVALLAKENDPGAALAKKAHAMGLVDVESVVWRKASPPLLRGLDDAADVHEIRAARIRALSLALEKGRPIVAEEVGFWAAMGGKMGKVKNRPSDNSQALSYWGETHLSPNADAQQWADAGYAAFWSGARDIARIYVLRSIERSEKVLYPLGGVVEELSHDKTQQWELFWDIDTQQQFSEKNTILIIMCLAVPQGILFLIEWLFPNKLPYPTVLHIIAIVVSVIALISLHGKVLQPHIELPKKLPKRDESRRSQDGPEWTNELEHAIAQYAEGHFRQSNEALAKLRALYFAVRPEHSKAVLRELLQYASFIDNEYRPAVITSKNLASTLFTEARTVGVHRATFSALIVELAHVLVRRGSTSEAEALLLKSLASAPEIASEPPLPTTAIQPFESAEANEYVNLFLAQPEAPEALPPETRLRALRILAEAMLAQGRYEEAEDIAQKASEKSQNAPPIARPEQWRTLAILGRARVLQGRYEEGHADVLSAITRAQEAFGKNHLEVARLLLDLARIEARHQDALAAETARRAITTWAKCESEPSERDDAIKELGTIAEGNTCA